jgi:hypothetical protein
LPQASSAKINLQTGIETAVANVNLCSDYKAKFSPMLLDLELKYKSQSESLIAFVRIFKEHKLKEKQLCTEWHNKAQHFDAAQYAYNIKSPDATEETLKEYKDFYDLWMNLKTQCEAAREKVKSEQAIFDEQSARLHETYCDVKGNQTDVCEKYANCYNSKANDYQLQIERIHKLEQHTKNVYLTFVCFSQASAGLTFPQNSVSEVNVLLGKRPTDNCNTSMVDISSLSLTYPETPAAEPCAVSVVQDVNANNFDTCPNDPPPPTTTTTTAPKKKEGTTLCVGDGQHVSFQLS